jgi:hypothetical protein
LEVRVDIGSRVQSNDDRLILLVLRLGKGACGNNEVLAGPVWKPVSAEGLRLRSEDAVPELESMSGGLSVRRD